MLFVMSVNDFASSETSSFSKINCPISTFICFKKSKSLDKHRSTNQPHIYYICVILN